MKKLILLGKLLKRVLIHKYWVAYYCFQVGLYWQGIIHDLSKFSLTEIKGSLKYWDNNRSSLTNERELLGYSRTFLHHRGRNPHHYEYWIHSLDNGGIPAPMPRKYALELVCDYLAACKTYGGNPKEEIVWWRDNCHKMKIFGNTKVYIARILTYFENYPLGYSVKLADKEIQYQY